MRTAIPTDLLLRWLNATPEKFAAVERILMSPDSIAQADAKAPLETPQHSAGIMEKLDAIHLDVLEWKTEYLELKSAKERLEKFQSEGLMKFTAKVDSRSFHVLCAIIAQGTVAKASQILKIPYSTVRDIMVGWEKMGPAYAVMLDLVRWRKRVAGKQTVAFNDAILYEDPKSGETESIFTELLDAVLSMTESNWADICAELETLLRKQLER